MTGVVRQLREMSLDLVADSGEYCFRVDSRRERVGHAKRKQ